MGTALLMLLKVPWVSLEAKRGWGRHFHHALVAVWPR